MEVTLEVDRTHDGRWVVDSPDHPGVVGQGQTPDEAIQRAQAQAHALLASSRNGGINFRAVSKLGVRLNQVAARFEAEGGELLSREEVEREVTARRGGGQ